MKRVRLIRLLIVAVVTLPILLTWPQIRQEWQNQALFAAVKNNDTLAVISLLDHGADANAPYQPNLYVALWHRLLQHFQGKSETSSSAPTPLIFALKPTDDIYPPENLPLVSALLDHGAKVHVRGPFGYSPLYFAIVSKKKATVHLLLARGAEINVPQPHVPLVFAAAYFDDDAEVISDMLRRGANVNQIDYNGDRAINWALGEDNVAAVRCLIAYHADVKGRDAQGKTLLDYEESDPPAKRNQQIIRLLKQAGAKE